MSKQTNKQTKHLETDERAFFKDPRWECLYSVHPRLLPLRLPWPGLCSSGD